MVPLLLHDNVQINPIVFIWRISASAATENYLLVAQTSFEEDCHDCRLRQWQWQGSPSC